MSGRSRSMRSEAQNDWNGAGAEGFFSLLDDQRVVGQTKLIPANSGLVALLQVSAAEIVSQGFSVTLVTEPPKGQSPDTSPSDAIAVVEFGAGNTSLGQAEIDFVQGVTFTVPGSYCRISVINNLSVEQRLGAYASYLPSPKPSRATRSFVLGPIAGGGATLAIGRVPRFAQDVVVFVGSSSNAGGAIGIARDFRFDLIGAPSLTTLYGQTVLGSQQMQPMPVAATASRFVVLNLDANLIGRVTVIFGIEL